MALFNKKPKTERCDMCDAVVSGDDIYSHESTHIAKIGPIEPAWLPDELRKMAQGEYTFLCEHCNSYPDIKWPKEGGASAGMQLHLGSAHYRGRFKGTSTGINFKMVPIR